VSAWSNYAKVLSNYWQGLAEHTALRIREFGRLQGYKKANARYYKLVVILDDRTSDICRALAAQDKLYPLNDALEVMDNLMALDTKSNSLDDAQEYIKALAPWIKDDQIEYDSEMNPVGVSGAHTPFPPFHWKCRTTSSILQKFIEPDFSDRAQCSK
jgi:hypothetical protein